MAGKKGQKHGPKKNISLFETAKTRTQKREVMYDPYNFAAVSEKFFREEKEAKEKAKLEKKAAQAKERASKLKVKKQALNKVKQNQRKITTELSKQIKGGQKQLDKQVKRLEKTTVTGPLGGEIKVKTLKKISGGAPGLDRSPRSKMFIGKKFSGGGSMTGKKLKRTYAEEFKENFKTDKRSRKIKALDKRNPVRALSRMIDEEYGSSPSEAYDEIHVGGKVYSTKNREPKTQQYKPQKDRDVGPPKVKKAMGGVMRNRGGTFKGVY